MLIVRSYLVSEYTLYLLFGSVSCSLFLKLYSYSSQGFLTYVAESLLKPKDVLHLSID